MMELPCSIVIYEGGSVMSQARSLWRLELARTKWTGGFINWYHPMRIRHITTGRYLGVNENNELVLVHSNTAFPQLQLAYEIFTSIPASTRGSNNKLFDVLPAPGKGRSKSRPRRQRSGNNRFADYQIW